MDRPPLCAVQGWRDASIYRNVVRFCDQRFHDERVEVKITVAGRESEFRCFFVAAAPS